MKIISIHNKEQRLLKEAKKQNRAAQQTLYETYAPKMLGVCRQYVKDVHHAEELMLSGFLKVFTHLNNFENKGSFEGWILKIMVNTCISYIRKHHPIIFAEDTMLVAIQEIENIENTGEKELQKLIDQLPEGYKLVFNLYAIEGYKHAEIAKQLGISESTSKSQLFKARKWLQKHYVKMNDLANGNK
ncbi:RNA polymerase sigma factor [Flavicella sediminum]|uniref:RNA polymerase sigma factor n=1 Tax=Flavicella sediminum TaxID=2585141 RepID=UPI001123AA26|nr:sigma-70 family RNA polymerase sigma factor [Flavicella sediminum]